MDFSAATEFMFMNTPNLAGDGFNRNVQFGNQFDVV